MLVLGAFAAVLGAASTLQRFVTHFPSKLFACLIIHSNFFGLASAL